MIRKRLFLFIFLIPAAFLCPPDLHAIPINFADFDLIDSERVTIFGPGNSFVTITEDLSFSFAPIALLDYDLAIPTDAATLSFDYELQVPADNEGYFDFYLADLTGPSNSLGGYEGVYAGTLTSDIRSFAGATLSIAFALSYGWDDFEFDSTLMISNARINRSRNRPPWCC